jgi:hypothetical protein
LKLVFAGNKGINIDINVLKYHMELELFQEWGEEG